MLMSALMIRRTHEDVTEQFKVPAQHHITKLVPPKYCGKFVLQLLHKAARRVSSHMCTAAQQRVTECGLVNNKFMWGCHFVMVVDDQKGAHRTCSRPADNLSVVQS